MPGTVAVIAFVADWDRWLREGGRKLSRPGETRDFNGTRYLLVGRPEKAMGVEWTDCIVLSPVPDRREIEEIVRSRINR